MAGTQKDPYAVLGVSRDADDKTIKRAYHRLAQTHHPDRNQDDVSAEERFKEISRAYAVVSDPKRRKAFDEFGSIALDPNFNADAAKQSRQNPFGRARYSTRGFGGESGADFGGIFEEFFANSSGGFSRQQAPRKVKGSDREVSLELELHEASEGVERSIVVGPGQPDNSGATRETLRVRIPKGTHGDARIRLAGKGDASANGGPPGDLYCRVRLRPHAFFKVDGHDLSLDVPIRLKEAILGAEIEIPTLSGRVTLNVPPGTDAGSRLRLRGKGMARPGNKPAGDLYVTLLIQVPKELDEAARVLVNELDRLDPTNPRAHLFE